MAGGYKKGGRGGKGLNPDGVRKFLMLVFQYSNTKPKH